MSKRIGMAFSTLTLASALAAAALAQPAAAGAAARAGPAAPDATANVAVRDDYFDPASISVPAGTTVRWTNLGEDHHTVTSDGGSFYSSVLYPGMTFSRTFLTPGTYAYHCQFHASEGMVGTVVVTGTGGGSPPPSGGNLALGKPIQASSSRAGYPPAMAVDGNMSTFWASRGSAGGPYGSDGSDKIAPAPAPVYEPEVADDAAPAARNNQWIYVDLRATYPLSQFRMQWNPGRHARAYGVYVYSGGCGWCLIGRTTTGDGDDTLTLRSPIHSRFVLLGLSDSAALTGEYELREWQVFGATVAPVPTPGSTNVARGRPATASSAMVGYPAGNATDGSTDTAWRSDQIPAWIYVDFGSVAAVNRAVLKWRTGEHAARYALYAWTSSGWRGVYATSSGDGADDAASFSPVQTRFLLLYGIAGPGPALGLNEFEVYGSLGGGYPLESDAAAQPDEAMWSTAPAGALDSPMELPALNPSAASPEGYAEDEAQSPMPDQAELGSGFPNPEEDAR